MGVDDKNVSKMLKHFRNLVNETASKASFLAAFQRQDSGSEPPQSEPEEAAAAAEAVVADVSREPSSNDLAADEEDPPATGTLPLTPVTIMLPFPFSAINGLCAAVAC